MFATSPGNFQDVQDEIRARDMRAGYRYMGRLRGREAAWAGGAGGARGSGGARRRSWHATARYILDLLVTYQYMRFDTLIIAYNRV